MPDYAALYDYISQAKQEQHLRNNSLTIPSFTLSSILQKRDQPLKSIDADSQKPNRYLYQSFDEDSMKQAIPKRKKRFNENLTEVVDDVRSSVGFTRNWRQEKASSIMGKMEEQRPGTVCETQSIKSFKVKKASIAQ